MQERAQELIGRAVVNLKDAVKVGTVADLIIEPIKRSIAGLVVQPLKSKDERWSIPVAQVHTIGPDAVTLMGEMANTTDKALADLPRFEQFRQNKVVTAGGKLIGHFDDLIFETTDYAILAYQLTGSLLERLIRHENRIPADLVQSFSKDIIIVSDSVATQMEAKEPKSDQVANQEKTQDSRMAQ